MQSIKPRDYLLEVEQQLVNHYEVAEANSLASIILEEYLGIDRAKLIINHEVTPSEEQQAQILSCIDKLKSYIPIQYILEKAPFFGRDFYVNQSVLIPRPETEELVDWIIKENTEGFIKILDIGTGTGCIPITLEMEMNCLSYGLDVSNEALEVANKNKAQLDVQTQFMHLDILLEPLLMTDLDIIVSNPPYVLEKEKEEMHQNVLNHEPGLALFVPDDRPLLFYEEIATVSYQNLTEGGKLYFEINENFGEKVVTVLNQTGFADVTLRKDINGKDRMVRAIKK